MAKIRSFSSTALVAVLIFTLFPSTANAFFGTCLCPAIMPAVGATGSANCQTGATCDPSKLQEHACTVSCIQPFAQPVFKTGLSWLTADKINCTNYVFYANNKIINPTKLNCMNLPRCDQCTYTMYSSECPEGYSCHPALLETNPYTNCTTVRCPNGYDGLIKHSDSPTVTELDSTLTCTSVNKRWKDYFGISYANNPSLRCAVRGAHPPTTTTTTSTTTTTTTSATTTTTMMSTAAPEGCLIPPNTPCDMPPERCTADIPIPDYTAGEMRCPSTSSLYVARTDTIGTANLYSWAGSIRCMANGLWRTTSDPTPRKYRYGIKIVCGVRPPESAPYDGCDVPPSPPLLSSCPGSLCSSIANATFVTYLGCKGLECPNGDQRIAVEGAAGTGTHIEIYKDDTFILFNGNQGELGVFPWSTPAACVTYDPNTPTTTTTPSTSTEKSQCASCSGYAVKDCRLYPCGVAIEEKTADGCRKFSCPEGFLAERYYLTTPTDRTYEAIALPATCETDGSTWTAAEGKAYEQESLYLTCNTPGGSKTPVTTPAPPPTCSKCTFTQPRTCRRAPCGDLSTETDSNGCLTLVCPTGFVLESIPTFTGTTYKEIPLPLTCNRDGKVWADASGSAYYMGNVLSCSTP